MISLAGLTMHYGSKMLFEDSSLSFNSGKRYGLVGANGVGKTTLLRLITGEETPSRGVISIPRDVQLGVLRQDHFRFEQNRILDVVLQGKPALWAALQEKTTLLDSGKHDAETGHRLAELEIVIAEQDGYVAEANAEELLSGLGILERYHREPMQMLSGGFKLRVLMAQLLFQAPDVLLLDEPTNHLDIVSIRWLESFLRDQFSGTLIFISHDRRFLNAVATQIVDIDYQEIRAYTGNCEHFLAAKALAEEQKGKEIESLERRVAEMQSFVDRFRYKATKARQAQSRVKQIEKLEIPEIRRSSRIAPKLQFQQERPSGRLVLKVKGLNKQFNQTPVLQDISFQVERGEKVALIGPNGIGKSTLLKIALEQLVPDSGAYEWGYEVSISYFAQDHHEQLQGSVSAYDWLYQFASHETVSFIRGLLGRVLLSGDEALKQVGALSGGEAARLLFAKIMLENRNVLVLDEPTNHLDLEGVEVLADALNAYPGTVIVVSHDRYFVAEIATHILELTPEGARDYPGNYQEYLNHFGDDHLSANSGTPRSRKPTLQTASKLSHEQRKDLKRNLAKLAKETERLETRISHAERELVQLNQLFSSDGFYVEHPSAEIERLQHKHQQLEQELSKSLASWETSSKQLETLRTQLDNAA